MALSAGQISTETFDLALPASTAESISVTPVGGIMQEKGVDYAVSLTGGAGGVTQINFSGGDLDPITGVAALEAFDRVIVRYEA